MRNVNIVYFGCVRTEKIDDVDVDGDGVIVGYYNNAKSPDTTRTELKIIRNTER